MYSFNTISADLSLLETYSSISNPSFITISKDGSRLYAASETAEYQGQEGGSVASFTIHPETGRLNLLNEQPTQGAAPCYLTLDPSGNNLYVANYSSGSISVFPVNEDGRLGELSQKLQHKGTGPDSSRQEAPHAHSIMLDAQGRYVLSADLGTDQIVVYEMEDNGANLVTHSEYSVKSGSGPRHMAFHPTLGRAYVINELDSTIAILHYDSTQGTLATIQTISTLPDNYQETSYCADIHISSDGRYLYGSNRGHDSIVVFAIDSEEGTLSLVEHNSTLGNWPRNFAISPEGDYLLAANQNSNSLKVFSIDKSSGKLTDTGKSADNSQPVCIQFLYIK
ncbi:6-phosphogluconolactonase [compost metagenome]